MECADHALCQRTRYIADPETDDLSRFLRMLFFIYLHSSGNLCKKVAVLYILIVFI